MIGFVYFQEKKGPRGIKCTCVIGSGRVPRLVGYSFQMHPEKGRSISICISQELDGNISIVKEDDHVIYRRRFKKTIMSTAP